jgi:hypothetical protein
MACLLKHKGVFIFLKKINIKAFSVMNALWSEQDAKFVS